MFYVEVYYNYFLLCCIYTYSAFACVEEDRLVYLNQSQNLFRPKSEGLNAGKGGKK